MQRRLALALVIAVGAVCGPGPGAADGLDVPARKAGCWKHTTIEGPFGKAHPDGSTFECVDAASEQARLNGGSLSASAGCGQAQTQKSGTTLVWTVSCSEGTRTAAMRTMVTGNFDASYTKTFVSRRSGGGVAAEVLKVVSRSKWISASCPANLQPGRMLIFGGAGCPAD